MDSPADDVHQLEFRWRPGKDLYPVAVSAQPASAVQDWFSKLSGFVRPASPSSPGIPDRSIVYQVFRDNTAAIVWRSWDPDAIQLDDGTERQPLVARALVGRAAALLPGTAVALCTTGWPAVAGPGPGQATPGSNLPIIAAAELSGRADEAAGDLDDLARGTSGLDVVIAAALRDRHKPLSVQLPQREIGQRPSRGPQAPMLWGLLQTVRPLLAEPDGRRPDTRGWTFSTYEPPPGGYGYPLAHRHRLPRSSAVATPAEHAPGDHGPAQGPQSATAARCV